MTSMAPWVADYIEAGYEIFPLRGKLPHAGCAECTPSSPRYRQHQGADCAGTPGHELCHGLLAATNDLERVARWWTRWPNANIGARVPKSLLVLDVDPRHGGHDRLAELEARHEPLPPTRVSYSGRGDGGHHRWFLHPGGKPSGSRLGEGLDLKGYGGYVVLPPSRHPDTGGLYRWAEPLADPAPLPGWLRRLVLPATLTPARSLQSPNRKPQGYVGKAIEAEVAQLKQEGGHPALTRAAFRLGQLAHLGITKSEEAQLIEELADAALIKASAPKSRTAALKTARECFQAGKDHPREPKGAA